MVCKVCGRNTEMEDSNFCMYCGASFREEMADFQEPFMKAEDQYGNQQYHNQQMGYPSNGAAEGDRPISFGNWLGTLLLPAIPIIGFFVNLVMLLVWSFGQNTPVSKKNWARAQLIVTVISYIILMLLVIGMFTSSVNGYDFRNMI